METLRQLCAELVRIYGMTAEVDAALKEWRKHLLALVVSSPATTMDSILFFGEGDPNTPGVKKDYQLPVGLAVARSETEGYLAQQVRRMGLITAFVEWERIYRPALLKEVGTEILSPAFGDLRYVRNVLLHAGGILNNDMTVLVMFKKGEPITLERVVFRKCISLLIEALNGIALEHFGEAPGFSLEKALVAAKGNNG